MQTGLGLGWEKIFGKTVFLKNLIVDRGSKYSVIGTFVQNEEEVREKIKKLKQEKYFAKATHNSYAYRLQWEYWVLEGKNDDGETGAGNCILRELQRENYTNTLVVVTRYFGGVQLHTDRFKNVIEATKKVLS